MAERDLGKTGDSRVRGKTRTPAVGSVLAAAFLLAAPPAKGLDPAPPLTRFLIDVWQAEQGLPINTVTAVHRTPRGYLWVGTEEGLVRFDGIRFTIFDRRTTPALANHSISALSEDRDGSLWVGTLGGGVVRLAPSGFETVPLGGGSRGEYIRSLSPARDGGVWAATDGGAVLIRDRKRQRALSQAQGLPADSVRTVREDSRGRLWIGTDSGLALLEAGAITVLSTANGLPSDWISSLLEDDSGTIWAGTTRGIARLAGNRFEPACDLPACRTQVWQIVQDPDGAVFAATSSGLLRFWKGRASVLDRTGGLARERLYCLSPDAEGSLWLGAEGGGLYRLKLGRFENITSRDGLPDDFIMTVFEDSSGRIWIGTPKGMGRLDPDGTVRSFARDSGLQSVEIRTLGEGTDGRMWAGTQGGGVGTIENDRFRRAVTIPDNNATSIHPSPDGSLWIGTFNGLFHLRGKTLTGFDKADGLPSNEVFCLAADRAGTLFLGTYGGGLAEMTEEGRFRKYQIADGVPSNTVTTLMPDADGGLWIGTVGGGIARLSGGKFFTFDSSRGLCDDSAFQIVDDRAGSLWTTSNRGIARTSRASLLDVAGGRRSRVECQMFGLPDGLRTRECNGGQQPAGIRASDGRLLFATARGLAVLDPRRTVKTKTPPRVLIEELRARGKNRDLSGRGIQLAPGENDLEIRYTGLDLLSSEQIRFRYQLEGYDSDWIEAGNRRTAFYTGLPPGQFVFRVGASNADGPWSEETARVSLELAPRFFQTRWFLFGVALSIAGAGAMLNQLRGRRTRRRAAELARIVEEKTHDLRETNERLEEANERIARMTESGFRAMDDVGGWAGRMAADLASALRVPEIDVYSLVDETLVPVSGTPRAGVPGLEDLKRATSESTDLRAGRPSLVPIRTGYGELLGAVAVPERSDPFSSAEERLILGFAHQLGATLELKRTREDLARAMSVRTARRQELIEKGIDILEICPVCQRCYGHQQEKCASDGATLVPPASFLPYRIQGKYRLLRVLGEGGMGTVFEAADERLDRKVALKVMRLDRFADREMLLRFQREARTLAQIDHPGVIAVYDTGELDEGSTFIVMELLKGVELATLLRTFGRGTPSQVARLLSQAASGLEAAHRQRIVHRDIKPENIVLTGGESGFQTKIVDFGLAKKIDAEGMTLTGMVVGSPHYMSPEQARGRPAGPLSDFFSLATVTYEALTGRKTVDVGDASDIGTILYDVMITIPPPPSVFVTGLSPEIDRLLLWALAKDPRARPQNSAEWVPLLVQELESTPASTPGWPDDIEALASPRRSSSSVPRTQVI